MFSRRYQYSVVDIVLVPEGMELANRLTFPHDTCTMTEPFDVQEREDLPKGESPAKIDLGSCSAHFPSVTELLLREPELGEGRNRVRRDWGSQGSYMFP